MGFVYNHNNIFVMDFANDYELFVELTFCVSSVKFRLDAHFAKDAADAGISAAIIPDLPLEESQEARQALNDSGLDLIPLVGFNTPPERLRKYAEVEQGFLYFVSVLGTTGVRETFPPELTESLKRVQEYFSIPVALGFGLTARTQLDEFGDLIDAGVIGSALIRSIAQGGWNPFVK
jgi:tryptophan synthase alpha chain